MTGPLGPASQSTLPVVLAISGASGAIYGVRLLQELLLAGRQVHLLVSPSATVVMAQELGLVCQAGAGGTGSVDPLPLIRYRAAWDRRPDLPEPVSQQQARRVRSHAPHDWMAPVASGSHRTDAMVICPCSGTTVSAIAHAAGGNLIHRAAEVHLKERRRLVVVPRETPLSTIALENLQRLSSAGAVVLPAMPGWYHGVTSLSDIVDFVVARILDQLAIEHALCRRWSEPSLADAAAADAVSPEERC